MPAPPESQPVVKRHIKAAALRIGSSLFDSIVDRAFGLLLLGVGLIVTPVALTIWLYVQHGRAAWVYPYLNFALGFLCACVVFIVASLILFYVQARRRKSSEQAKNLKFVSQEKGYLDHRVIGQKSNKELVLTFQAIGKEIGQIVKTSGIAVEKFNAAERIPGERGATAQLKVASEVAAKFDKHSARMERQLEKLQAVAAPLIESNAAWLKWVTSQPTADEQQLEGVRQATINLLGVLDTSAGTMRTFRASQENVKAISQDLHTAMNRLGDVIDGILEMHDKLDAHLKELVKIVGRRLRR